MLPTSRSLAPSGSHRPAGLLLTTALSSKASRNVCHDEACMLCSVPLPLCRSRYSGARYGRSCGHVVVAHINKPSARSRSLRGILRLRASSCSCICSLSSLPAASWIVSKSKLKVQPHHVISCPNCAFFQLMGACTAVRKHISSASCSTNALRARSTSKSSTYIHALCACLPRSACTIRSSIAPRRCHQYAEKRAPKWQTT